LFERSAEAKQKSVVIKFSFIFIKHNITEVISTPITIGIGAHLWENLLFLLKIALDNFLSTTFFDSYASDLMLK
jgi:hypothetical protein